MDLNTKRITQAVETRPRRNVELHFITPEYPPRLGGVGDYVFLVANELAEMGDTVHVWCPRAAEPPPEVAGVTVHYDLGRLSPADLVATGRALDRFTKPRRICLQWVPHGFGWRSLNVPFCLWIWARSRVIGDDVRIMVHEPSLGFREGNWRQDAAAVVHRLMTIILLLAAREIWVAIPQWERRWKSYTLGRRLRFSWLPVPSNVPVVSNPERTAAIRARHVKPGELLVGHFGTFGKAITPMLDYILPGVLSRCPQSRVLLIGPKSLEYSATVLDRNPELKGRVYATGPVLAKDELSWHLAACDLMVQPFPDGASTRRTSLLAQLAHGLPVITTTGASTEPLLLTAKSIVAVPVGDLDGFVSRALHLLGDPEARACLAKAERKFYDEHFRVEAIVNTLRTSYAQADNT